MNDEMMPKTLHDFRRLIGSIAVFESAGVIGAVFTTSSMSTWYQTLRKPSSNPPSKVFGPVWTALYLLMGVALYLTRRRPDSRAKSLALRLFTIQLILNTLWSFIFFKMRSPGWALAEIGVLWVAIALTFRAMLKVSRLAACLLLPYLLWTSFAAVLNFSIARASG